MIGTINILAAPVDFNLKDTGYAKSYNLLRSLSSYDVKFYAIVNDVSSNIYLRHVKFVKLTSGNKTIDRILFQSKMLKVVREILNEQKISIVHHFNLPYGGYNLLALTNIIDDYPFVVGPVQASHMFLEDDYIIWSGRSHSLIRLEYNLVRLVRSMGSPIIGYAFEKTLEKADVIVAVNKQTKKIYSKFVDSNKIKVIPIGVNLNEFQFSMPPLNYDILSVGFLIKRKGFEYLIRAMPDILKEFPSAKLHILGDGPQRGYLENLVKKLGLESHIKFYGRVPKEKVMEFYKKCRVFVHPSLSESFSPVRLEAMASGIPVVATNAAVGAEEMIIDGKTGFLVPPKDPKAISEAVKRIFSDEKLTYKLAINARKKVEKEYDWNKIGKKYYEFYEKLRM